MLFRSPGEFLIRARLRRLLLCAKLQEGNEPIPSLPNYHDALIIDVDADPVYLRRPHESTSEPPFGISGSAC